jgi:hypothetical protein
MSAAPRSFLRRVRRRIGFEALFIGAIPRCVNKLDLVATEHRRSVAQRDIGGKLRL